VRAERRAATLEEREVVDWLLRSAATTTGAASLLNQVPDLHVVGGCDCGCPSVDFEIDGQDSNALIIADARGTSPEGVAVGLILWAKEGRLTGLEVYDFEGIHEYRLPRPEMLTPTFGRGAV
jgi:hypothetical protein